MGRKSYGKGLQRQEVPDGKQRFFSFDSQGFRYGKDNKSKYRTFHVWITCELCGAEFWRSLHTIRKALKNKRGQKSKFWPLCHSCACCGISRIQRQEVPVEKQKFLDFDRQELRYGKDNNAKHGTFHIWITCELCGAEFWRSLGEVRRALKKQESKLWPLCCSCAYCNAAKIPKIPSEWQEFINWDQTEIRKRRLYVEVTCPGCRQARLVAFNSLLDPKRKGLNCRSCTGKAFKGSPDRPARRRRLMPEEVQPVFRQFCHFEQQKVITEPHGKKLLYILTDCPDCGQSRWKRVAEVRYLGRPGFCRACGVKRRYFLKPDKIREDWRPFIVFDSQQNREGETGPVVIQVQCPTCKDYRWLLLTSLSKMAREAPPDQLPNCTACGTARGRKNSKSKQRKRLTKQGYVSIPLNLLNPADQLLARQTLPPCEKGKNKTSITEHRLVMARYLKRPLRPHEQVHHRNSDRADNRLANLRLVTSSSHPAAPRDQIAILSVEIEAVARELSAMGINSRNPLQDFLSELKRLKPESLFGTLPD